MRSRKQRLVAEINITPFTDVILVLLVIFMIITPIISESSIKIKLPKAQGKENKAKDPGQTVTSITITREGLIYLGGKLVTNRELKTQIIDIAKRDPDLAVTVRSDRLVPFKDVVTVLDILSELGITKVNIATIKET